MSNFYRENLGKQVSGSEIQVTTQSTTSLLKKTTKNKKQQKNLQNPKNPKTNHKHPTAQYFNGL